MGIEDERAIVPKAEHPLSIYSEEVRRVPIEWSLKDLLLGGILRKARARWETAWEEAQQEANRIFEQDLAKKGILGEHELIAPAQVQRGVWSTTDGALKIDQTGFLFFTKMHGEGKLEGDSRTVSSVQFAWSPNGKDILIAEIPLDKMTLNVDPSALSPRVSFTLNRPEFIKLESLRLWTVKSYPYTNDYLRDRRLLNANFTFSSNEDLKGLPLPAIQLET